MQSLLEKLNTPAAVVTVLVVILLANGLLLYQSRSSSPETPPQVSEQASDNGSSGSPNQDTGDGAATQEPTTAPEETTPPESTTAPEETRIEETQPEEEPEETAPESEETQAEETEEAGPTLLAGLSSSVRSCRESSDDDEQCIRDFVSEVAPDSRYVGGRTDLAPDGSGDNTEFIYFEDPRLAPCEYERAEYEEDGSSYAVFLIGEGSFSDTRGDQCIPQA